MARTAVNDELSDEESLIISAIEAGTYFVENEVPAGTMNGSNVTFTVATAPNPAASFVLMLNGATLKGGGEDYTLSGLTITMGIAPESGELLLAEYRVDPNP